ncbi:MAG: DUF3313 family protein [Piscinibacter sp.]|nr:DUF3313 family protein [Piscinibacter sp.]
MHSARVAAALGAALLAGCAAAPAVPPGAAFLSDETRLVMAMDGRSARARPRQGIDPARVTLVVVEWRAGPHPDIAPGEQAALLAMLQAQLQEGLRDLPAQPAGRPVRLRAAITQLDTVSPLLNTTSALLLFVPLDSGGASVEVEALDASSGQQLAALRFAHTPSLSEFGARFHRLGPAEIALRRAGAAFAALLREGEDGS